MDDAADHPAVVNTRLATRVRRQMWRDLRELRIREPKNDPDSFVLPPGSRESHRTGEANQFMGPNPKIFILVS